MGIDALDIRYRLEKTFIVTIDNEELYFVFDTVSSLYEFVWQKLHGIHPAIPLVGWRIAEYVLTNTLKLPGNTLMVDPSEIKPEARLVQDLGMD